MNSNVFQALKVIMDSGAHFEAINTLVSDVERQYGLAINDLKSLQNKVNELESAKETSDKNPETSTPKTTSKKTLTSKSANELK